MTLSRKIADALDENTRAYTPPCSVTVDEGPDRVVLEIAALDTVGVSLDSLEYVATDRREWTSQALNAWGADLARRVNYLMEPLAVLEADGGLGLVQLRSQAPTARGDLRSYYEVRLDRAGTCQVERYSFNAGEGRRRLATCNFTREVLERLADDIAASSR